MKKAQSVEALAADRDYCEWLLAQPWFASRYGNVYNVIINYGAEPQDSPEHNEMQARFLDDDWCLRLADLMEPELQGEHGLRAARLERDQSALVREFRECLDFRKTDATIRSRQFEHGGWDVIFQVMPGRAIVEVTTLDPLDPCICRCDHDECSPEASCHDGDSWCRHQYHGRDRSKDRIWMSGGHCTKGCPWGDGGRYRERADPESSRFTTKAEWLKEGRDTFGPYMPDTFYIELKPDLGDDYPAVLRQVQGYKAIGVNRVVIVRRHAFQHVTWKQVEQIFDASGLTLIAEADIATTPEERAMKLVQQELGGELLPE